MRHLLAILAISLLLLTGCRHSASDPGIRMAEQLADSLPAEALAILDTIPAETLSGHDLFLHRFLTIKTNDKLYVTHTSDSLLLPVLKYAHDNRRSVNYPEVLYYAGRVYDDLGDYPTALDYYHQALDALPDDKDLKLRAKLLSNLGYIYTNSCLYEEGIKTLKEAIRLDSICCDTLNMIYDLISLGDINFEKKNFSEAESIYKHVISLAEPEYPHLKAEQKLNLANIKLFQSDFDSARVLIEGNINKVEPVIQDRAHALAAEIYYYSGMTDSAFYYANEVLKSKSQIYKPRAYTILLSSGLIGKLPKDSISSYIRKHNVSVKKILEKNSKKEIFIKNSQYNYFLQQRERLKAEKKSLALSYLVICTLTIILIISLILFWMKFKTQQQRMKIIEFQKDITLLREELAQSLLGEIKFEKELSSNYNLKGELLKKVVIKRS